MHDDFGFWLEGTDAGPAALAGLEQANEAILPTVRLDGLDAAYWVRPERRPRAPALGAARARGAAARRAGPARGRRAADLLGEGTRYAGAFRAHGLVVPVWDLPADVPAEDWAGPATEFQTRLEAALAVVRAADRRRATRPRRAALPPDHPALTRRTRPRLDGRVRCRRSRTTAPAHPAEDVAERYANVTSQGRAQGLTAGRVSAHIVSARTVRA